MNITGTRLVHEVTKGYLDKRRDCAILSHPTHAMPEKSRYDIPRCMDIRATLDEQADYEIVPSRTSDMQREDSVENRVDGLAVIESVGDETEVSRRGSRVEAEVGNCKNEESKTVPTTRRGERTV